VINAFMWLWRRNSDKHEHLAYPIPGRTDCVVCLQLQVEKLRGALVRFHKHTVDGEKEAVCVPEYCVAAQALADSEEAK